MITRLLLYRTLTLLVLVATIPSAFAQISGPGRNWADTTKYTKVGVKQDSIFVFFSTPSNPKKGSIKAKFSDGSTSNFRWYKYDPTKPISSRFINFFNENGVNESKLVNIDKGGYKVVMTRTSDLAVDSSACWVFIDSVKISNLSIDNRCDFLELITNTIPSKLSIINYSIFSYWDYKSSSSYHRINDALSRDYFKVVLWKSSESKVQLPSNPSTILMVSPAPLYDSKYSITVTNPFGRILSSETEVLPAKAPKADFTLFVDKKGDNTWTEDKMYLEAPLQIKFDTKAINADSVYWQIINDTELFKKGGDSILWREGYITSNGINVIPTEKLLPGTFNVEHIAVKVNSGCRDTMNVSIKVDSSFIKPEDIPNVFSPNGDEINDFFVFQNIEASGDNAPIKSIKSFKISILSRQGMLVYSFTGNPKEWEGWDGKMEGSKRDAPEGIYFFIIEAQGWDEKTFKRGPYKGFLYLYRGK